MKHVLFIGTYIPLHRIDIIVEAAKLLSNQKDIVFTFVGNGQTRPQIEKMVKDYDLKNIKFIDAVKYEILPKYLEKADLCLGIFGGSRKSESVIPFKVAYILGSQKPLLTADTPAIREAGLKNNKNCILIRPESSSELSKAILSLKENPKLLEHIAKNGYENYKEKLSMEKAGKTLVRYLNEVIIKTS